LDREKEIQYLKDKFEQVRKAHAQELDDLKAQFDTMLRTRIVNNNYSGGFLIDKIGFGTK